jgi:signal transduction histidine kinase
VAGEIARLVAGRCRSRAGHHERRSDELATLIAEVRHDANNSLMAILGYLELLFGREDVPAVISKLKASKRRPTRSATTSRGPRSSAGPALAGPRAAARAATVA